MGAPAFWDNPERAQKHISKLNTLKRTILPVMAFQKKVDDVDVMVELVESASAGEEETGPSWPTALGVTMSAPRCVWLRQNASCGRLAADPLRRRPETARRLASRGRRRLI